MQVLTKKYTPSSIGLPFKKSAWQVQVKNRIKIHVKSTSRILKRVDFRHELCIEIFSIQKQLCKHIQKV